MNKFCFDKKEKEKILLKQPALPGRKFSNGTVDFGLKDTADTGHQQKQRTKRQEVEGQVIKEDLKKEISSVSSLIPIPP